MSFLKLTVNVNGAIGSQKDNGVPADINFDHVLKITRDTANGSVGSKLTYVTNQTDRVYESPELIEKLLRGEKVGAYHDPNEPEPKNA